MPVRKYSGINLIVLLLSFTVVLLTVSNRMTFSFQTQTGVTLLLIISSFFLLNNYRIKLNSYVIPLILLFMSTVISYFLADYQANVRNHMLILSAAVLAGFNITFLPLNSRRNLFFVPVFAGLFLSMVLFSKFLVNPAGLFDSGVNFCVYSGLNADITAAFFVMIYPLIFVFIREKINTKVFSASAFFILCAVILTKSHYAVIIALSETFILLFGYIKNKSRYKVVLPFCLVFLFAIILYIYSAKSGFAVSLQQQMQWKTAFLIFKENIFFGCGAGNYPALFDVFRPELVPKSDYAGNIVLQFLAEYGLAGLLFFVLFLCSFYIKAVRKIAADKNIFFYKAVVLSATSFLILNFFNGSFFVPVHMAVFFMLVCSVFSAEQIKRSGQKIPVYISAAGFAAVFILMIMPVIADVYYKKGVNYYITKQYNLSASSFETAVKFDRKNPEYYNQSAKAYFALFDKDREKEAGRIYIDKAEEYTLKALSLYKNETYLRQSLGYIYINKGEKDKAVRTMEEAEKYDKFNADINEIKYEFINT